MIRIVMIMLAVCALAGADSATANPRLAMIAHHEMALIPGGTFIMVEGDDATRRVVTLSPFWCARRPVTKGDAHRWLDSTGATEPAWVPPKGDIRYHDELSYRKVMTIDGTPTDRHAVHWDRDISDRYAQWLSTVARRPMRRISEAELEWVRRGGEPVGPGAAWWTAKQPGGIAAWWYNADAIEAAPQVSWLGTDSIIELYAQNPWRVWIGCNSVVTRDGYTQSLAPGQFTDPEITPLQVPTREHLVTRVSLLPPNSTRWPSGTHNRLAHGGTIWLTTPWQPGDEALPPPPRPGPAPIPVPVEPLPRRLVDLGDGQHLTMLAVPGGRFEMGRDRETRPWSTEWPVTPVELEPYELGMTEVTQAQYRAVTGLSLSLVPGDDRPVHSLTFIEQLAFCDLLTRRERAAGRLGMDREYRLPTEPEWERAALAGTRTLYPWGDDPAALPWYEWIDAPGGPHPIATKWPNRWGFYDMGGNVMERLSDQKYQTLPGSLIHGNFLPYPLIGSTRAGYAGARGGAWVHGAEAAVPTHRRGLPLYSRTYAIGFRVACGPVYDDGSQGSKPLKQIFPRKYLEKQPPYEGIMKSATAARWLGTVTGKP
jgi:formylglycine-generating enzyme required for sulfatase activity